MLTNLATKIHHNAILSQSFFFLILGALLKRWPHELTCITIHEIEASFPLIGEVNQCLPGGSL